MAPPLSAMGGLLVRHTDGWRWSDGSLEPRVRDLTAAEAFELPRVRSIDPSTGAVADYVSIPRTALDEDADLLGDVISPSEATAAAWRSPRRCGTRGQSDGSSASGGNPRTRPASSAAPRPWAPASGEPGLG